MRIFTVYFQVCLFLIFSLSATSLFGNRSTTKLEKDIEFDHELVLPDTTCGLTDTVVQLTFPTCIGDADATARIEIMGSPGPFNFVWDNQSRGATGTGLSAGKHFVSVTDLEGCTLIDSIIIQEKPPFDYNIQIVDALCVGVPNGSITISDNSDYTYNWSTGDTVNNLSNLGAGIYGVIITDTLGCEASETLTINNSTQASLEIDGSNATCAGISDGTLSVNDTLNLSGYSYLWSTGDSTNTISDVQPGTYFVLVTSPEGCLAADSIDIGINRTVPLVASVTNATCAGLSDGAISINDSLDVTGYQFGWSNGATTQSIDNITAGVYSVAIADSIGCIAAATIEVPNTTQFSFTSSVTDGTCDVALNGSIIINESTDVTGYTFNWSTGDSGQMLTNVIPDNYAVTVTDENGCTATDSIIIGITRDLHVGFEQTNTTCEGLNDGSVTLTGRDDFSDLIIVWSTGDSTLQTLTGLAPTNYSFLVTDSVGCSVFGAPIIGVGTTFEVDVTVTDASCIGVSDGSITLNDTLGVDGLTIAWSTGDSTQTITGLAAGEYDYVVTDTAGCNRNGTVLVGNQLILEVDLSKSDVSCQGLADGTILASTSGEMLGNTYIWSTNDSTQNLSNLAAGTYTVTATNSVGCIGTESISILDLNSISFSISQTGVSCIGLTDGTATVNAGVSSGLTINWSTGDSTQTIDGLGIGTYTATVMDENGCIATESIEVVADSSLQLSLTGNRINCAEVDNGRINASIIGGSSNEEVTFLWNTDETTASISNLAPGNYQVTVTDSTGCFGVGNVSLSPADTLNIILTTVPPECMDTTGTGALFATATGGSGNFSYNWSTGDTTDAIGQLVAGTYFVTVSDSEGCTHVDSATLVNPPNLIVNTIETQAATCVGTADGIADVQVSGGTTPYNILWNTGIITPTLSNLDPGLYTVEVTDAAGCQESESIAITQTTSIDLEIIELSAASGESIADAVATVTATGGQAPYTANWDNGAVGDTVSNLSPGVHDLIVTDANGCIANGSIETGFFELDVNIIEVRDLRCNGDVNGRATAEPITGIMPFTYLWSTGDTTPIVTTLTGDEHTVTVTDAEGKRGKATVTIGEPQPINFNLEIIPPGCPTSSNGRIIINATGIVGNALYEFGFGISPDNIINGVSAGDKTFGVLDARGCRADTMFTIEALSPNPPTPIFGLETLGLIATFSDSSTNQPNEYLWKFGDGTTSMEVNPIHAYPDTGNYEVSLIVTNSCATDSVSQMIRIDPIPVPAVDLFFGRDTSGLSGQVVSIPVTVGAFDGVAGISGTFELTNPAIGVIQGVSALNLPALIQENIGFQDNLINIDWQLPDSLALVSLPAGTQIFVIDVLLTGASDECSRIVATNSESPVQFIKTFNGQLVPAPFNISSAEFCVAQTVSISGNISREEATAIEGVMVTTNGDVASTTATDGNYALPGLPGGSTFNITPAKSDDLLDGVTAFDLVRILQHILTQSPLDSPYKIIAADIDNSGSVSSLDLVHLQRLILGSIDTFPNNQPWRFVPENYSFINPSNPLGEDFPENIEITRLEIDTANIDFIAIKIGDVIGAANTGTARFSPKSMGFKIEEQSFKTGNLVTIPFNFEQSNNSLGFQFELAFDPNKLAFKTASKGNYLNISEHNLGITNIEEGRLKLLWVNQQQVAIRPSIKGAFQLEFVALQDGNLSDVLELTSDLFPAQFYSKEGKQIGIQTIELDINNALTTASEEEILLPNEMALMQGGENLINGGCGDGIDNDNDGLIDCADADCFCECNTAGGENLIINPSAELSLSSGGWQLIQGTWTTKSTNPAPQDGAAYFYPLSSEVGQISQVIDLSADAADIDQGMVSYVFSGYARSIDEDPVDQGQILIEYRNGNDSTVARFDSGILTETQDWLFIGDTTLVPIGTRVAIINLISRRNNGSNNDAYYDNLSLGKMVEENCMEACEGVDLFTIVTDAIPNGIGGTASTSFIGGVGPISYSWSNGESTNEVSNLIAGNYTVVATDSIGCTVMDSIEVNADSTFFASLNIVNNICAGENNGTIEVEIIGGIAPYSLVWEDTTLSGSILQNLPNGNYSLTVTDSTNATVFVSATITSAAQIVLSNSDSKIVEESCPNVGDGQLSLVAEGGTAPYSYVIGTDTTDNGVYLNLNAGAYIVNITDANGCSVSDNIVVGNTIAGILSAEFTASVDDQTINLSSAINDTLATYSWTFGNGSTSTDMNPSVTYTDAGAFEICLSITNECGTATTCQTLTVGVTGPVKFVVNRLNGIANDTVTIPITVENFVNIVSYQNTIQIQDTSIARFVGVSAMNLEGLTAENFFQIDDHTISNVWFDASATGQSLPTNTVIYNLMVMINSAADTCVSISIGNSPVPSQVVGIIGNEVAEVPFEIENGEICTQESAQITGNITREIGTAVPDVQIGVSNFDMTSTTDINGDYLVDKLSIGGDYEITPSLNTPLLESVSTFDIVLINRHILGTGTLDSPYKIIAADINKNNSITVFDLVLIQRAILRLNSDFPGNAAWRFIPRSYEFLDPLNPLDEEFPESISLTDLNENLSNQDFVAIKVADVSYNVETAGLVSSDARTNHTLNLEITNQNYNAGELIEIPITAKDLNTLAGFQLELDFDRNNLELIEVETIDLVGLDQNNIGVNYLNQGKLQMVWVAPNVELSKETTTLFNLRFKAKVAGNLSNKLQLANRFLTTESYTKDLTIGEVALNISYNSLLPLAELSVFPNPSKGLVDLTFANSNKEAVQISMYNFAGQLVQEWKNVTDDNLQINIANQADGTYLIMLKRATNVEVKRVVLSR